MDQAHSLSTLLTSEVTQHNSLTPGCLLRNRGRSDSKLQIRNANCLLLMTSIAMNKVSNVVMWCINDHFSAVVNFVLSTDTCIKCQFISVTSSSYCSDWNYYLFSIETKKKMENEQIHQSSKNKRCPTQSLYRLFDSTFQHSHTKCLKDNTCANFFSIRWVYYLIITQHKVKPIIVVIVIL